MLHNYREALYHTIETVGAQEGIERVRIFNKEGTIMFSSDRTEIGKMVGKEAEACYACHAVDKPLERLDTPKRTRIFSTEDHRVMGMITPIYNDPDCYQARCHVHPPEQKVLGVLDVSLSLAATDLSLQEIEHKTVPFAVITIIAVSAIISYMIRRTVHRPVKELVAGTTKVAAGDFNHTIPAHYRDEIGQLAESFNTMTGKLKKADGEIRDLIKNLEQRVEERTAKLKEAQYQLVQSEKLASIGKLAATIAHEINNPLSGILTYTKLIDRKLHTGSVSQEDIEKYRSYLSVMERETERCSSIVKNLLDFARQREPSFKSDVDVNLVAEDALSLLANQVALQDIRVEKKFSKIPSIMADPVQLRQVLVNLIVNSCEAIQDNGKIVITTQLLESDHAVQIKVADNGVGIPPEDLTKILDPFFTSKEKGTGLGLAVVYGIVNSHQGKIHIDSTVGKGTTFTITLPIEVHLSATEKADAVSDASHGEDMAEGLNHRPGRTS